MKITVQIHIDNDSGGGQETTVWEVERDTLTPAILGLQLAESKTLLQTVQQAMVQAQVLDFLDQARPCPECQAIRACKGQHTLNYRTVFGKLSLPSIRLYSCRCQTSKVTASISPLAQCLTERSSPELRYLQAKYAALMSYGLSLDVLCDVLPIAEAVSVTSAKRRVRQIADRLKPDVAAIEADWRRQGLERSTLQIPDPSPVRAVGVDGGYIHHCYPNGRQDGWFEAIVGKSLRDDGAGRCFGYRRRWSVDCGRLC